MKRKQKNQRVIVTAIVIALLLLISIGYAAISTTLKINGTANIAATSWNVYFENIQETGGNVTPTTEPTINETETGVTWAVNMEKPGDFYEFTVDVKNAGTLNAKIAENGIKNTELTETQKGVANYTVTYLDGTEIAEGDKLTKSGETVEGIGDTRTIKVRVEYNPEVTVEALEAMGDEDMTLDLEFSIEYVQD